jgi:hypothetical protein
MDTGGVDGPGVRRLGQVSRGGDKNLHSGIPLSGRPGERQERDAERQEASFGSVGTYLEKETETRSDRINKDQLTVLAAGIVETDIIDEKWEGRTYWLKSKMTLDSDEVISSMDTLRRDRERTREVEELGKQADGLLRESEKRIRDLAVA